LTPDAGTSDEQKSRPRAAFLLPGSAQLRGMDGVHCCKSHGRIAAKQPKSSKCQFAERQTKGNDDSRRAVLLGTSSQGFLTPQGLHLRQARESETMARSPRKLGRDPSVAPWWCFPAAGLVAVKNASRDRRHLAQGTCQVFTEDRDTTNALVGYDKECSSSNCNHCA
jgi:hypothetical protein